ncbi:hypothetical protein V8F33_002316 [Rhypophila sp. PSN 637]
MFAKSVSALLLLALAGFSDAYAVRAREPQDITIEKRTDSLAPLVKRADIDLRDGGTIVGTFDDKLTTYGLATCPGIAAFGVATNNARTSKILSHILCGNYPNWLNLFHQAMNNAQLQFPSIILSVGNPALQTDPDLREAQKLVNRDTFAAVTQHIDPNELWRIVFYERESLFGGEPDGAGELQIAAGTPQVFVERKIAINPVEPPTVEATCSWPFRYLAENATPQEIQNAHNLANQICQQAVAGGKECPAGTTVFCDDQLREEGLCACIG